MTKAFAQKERVMDFLGLICIVGIIVWLANRSKERKDNELLKENPEAWAAKKLVEEEVAHRKRQSQVQTGAHIGMEIAKRFLQK